MEFNLLFAGRPVMQKGLKDLFMALSLLKEYNWKLTIVGELPSEISTSQLTIKNRLTLVGAQSNDLMPMFLNQHDILIVPSHYENFGNIIIEGLACGTVIVAAKTGGIKDLITHGYNGFFFEPKNYIQLSNKIKYIFDNPYIMKDIGENALLSSIRYDWKNIIAETLVLFEKYL